jgi:glucokinase
MLLAGDIGGTKTDLAVISPHAGPRAPVAKATFHNANYIGLDIIVRSFLEQTHLSVDYACFAVAGPVVGGQAQLTNLKWMLQDYELKETLHLQGLWLLNDLEATANAIPHLVPSDLYTLRTGEAEEKGPIAVIAPGTGLGEAYLTWHESGYQAHASEGGHENFAPINLQQLDLLRYLLNRFNHVSYERVCSGLGISTVYDYLQTSGHARENPALASRIMQATDRTPLIIEAALDKNAPSRLCTLALETFVAILGAEAGNLALKVLATGGVYLGGGIPPRILPLLQSDTFMHAFMNKGRMTNLLAHIPIHVIKAQAAMLGAASYALDKMGQ